MRKTWLIFSQTVTVAVAIVFVLATFRPSWIQALSFRATLPDPSLKVAPPARAASGAAAGVPLGFREAAQRAAPAVVSVLTSNATARHPHRNDPWFRYFFGEQDGQPQSGIGSGVNVSPEGYILTNNHVVEHMDDSEIMLIDGRCTSS